MPRPRKPSGVERPLVAGERRLSFCCAREGCGCCVTPPSVRYFGRRVYVAFVFVFLTAMSQGVRSPEFRLVVDRLGIDKRTLQRWRRRWRKTFVETSLWRKPRPVSRHVRLFLLVRCVVWCVVFTTR